MVATDIVHLSLLNKRPDLRLLKVLQLVLVSRSKVGAHATVVASDDHAALAGRLGIVHTVLGVHTSLGAGVLQDIGVLVTADTSNVENGVVRENVLRGGIIVNIRVIEKKKRKKEFKHNSGHT